MIPGRAPLSRPRRTVLNFLANTPVAAFSVRKINPKYTGFCMNVRRSSDNTAINIPFNVATGEMNITALLLFVGSGSGYVTSWYDQSGNGLNATQATATNQPIIVSSGVLQTFNGKPGVAFNGTTQYLQTATSQFINATTGTWTANAVTSSNSTNVIVGTASSAGNKDYYISSTQAADFVLAGTETLATTTTIQPFITTGYYDGTNVGCYGNGTGLATTALSSPNTATGTSTIGIRPYFNTLPFNGAISEILQFTAFSNSDRQIFEINQSIYFNIPGVL
jgi:hypothetical protein